MARGDIATPSLTERFSSTFRVEWMGGMWYHSSQVELLAGYLKEVGIELQVPHTAENAFNGKPTFKEFVDQKTEKIERHGVDTFIVCHSYGIHVATRIAEKTSLVKGIVSLATGAHLGIWTDPEPRSFSWDGIKALLGGGTFNVPRQHQEFILDGAHCKLGMASGKVLRKAVLPFILGYKTPMLRALACRTHLIIPMDDKLIPLSVAKQIAIEHGAEASSFVHGGHFAHNDPRFSREVGRAVAWTVGSWVAPYTNHRN